MNIVIDTSVVIEHLRAQQGWFFLLLKDKEIQQTVEKIIIPSVVIYELWSGKSMSSLSEVRRAEKLLANFSVRDVTPTIAKRAGQLRREGYVSGIDALIAATALEEKAHLATLNIKHFQDVPNLRLLETQDREQVKD